MPNKLKWLALLILFVIVTGIVAYQFIPYPDPCDILPTGWAEFNSGDAEVLGQEVYDLVVEAFLTEKVVYFSTTVGDEPMVERRYNVLGGYMYQDLPYDLSVGRVVREDGTLGRIGTDIAAGLQGELLNSNLLNFTLNVRGGDGEYTIMATRGESPQLFVVDTVVIGGFPRTRSFLSDGGDQIFLEKWDPFFPPMPWSYLSSDPGRIRLEDLTCGEG